MKRVVVSKVRAGHSRPLEHLCGGTGVAAGVGETGRDVCGGAPMASGLAASSAAAAATAGGDDATDGEGV
tara:strand:+ start:383 stop:592 length:210 start_codon:yes stop_codon:yes gene_type:complete